MFTEATKLTVSPVLILVFVVSVTIYALSPLTNDHRPTDFCWALALMNRENAQEPGSHVNVDVIPTVGMDRT
jgi:hypothetical protein